MSRNPTSADALEMLLEGNTRFVRDQIIPARNGIQKRLALMDGQTPFAVIVGCSDSRVCPEIIFDAELGDLFVIRTAGHVIDDTVVGSMEYAVQHLHVPLIVILGHSCCGAVTAAVNCVSEVEPLNTLLQSIHQSIRGCLCDSTMELDRVIEEHTRIDVEQLQRKWSFFRPYVQRGDLKIVAANYCMSNGEVTVFEPRPEECSG